MAAKTKRMSGYDVTIKGFVPADPTDVDEQIRIGGLVKDAQEGGGFADLLAEMTNAKFTNKFTSKQIPVDNESASGGDSARDLGLDEGEEEDEAA